MISKQNISTFLVSLTIFNSLINISHSTELCHPNDKKVLLQIKNQLGPKSNFFATWRPNTDCCKDWFNSGCDNKTNRVTILQIGGNELFGEIPPVVGELTSLERLWINDMPGLTGSIPSSISNLINLQEVMLARTNLTGSIPPFFGRFKKLFSLDLSENRLSGPIPASLSLATSLRQLILYKNQLTGPVPASFGSFKNNLFFQAYENQLTGPIPNSLSQAGFGWFDLSRNRLTGDASILFGPTKKLVYFNVSNNALSFDFSKVVFPKTLQGLDVSHNMIYGSLPKQLAELPLKVFDVSSNQLCGPIPQGKWLSQFTADAFAHNKCLCGSPLAACK